MQPPLALPPTYSVLMCNHNYREYIVQAVKSALEQTLPPLEVVVVDDGSTDGSWDLLQQTFGTHPSVTLIRQANGGQLSAWITGFSRVRGDVVAFLDSDDEWLPGYLEAMDRVYRSDASIDYVYCNMEMFGSRTGIVLNRARHRRDRDHGLSRLIGAFVQRWQGVATSGNTIRRPLLKRILDLPAEQIPLWRTRADDCLYFGGDILGAHKYYLAAPLVRYRQHTRNVMLEYKQAPLKTAHYAYYKELMLEHYRKVAGCTPGWLRMAKYEFRTKPRPTWSEWRMYARLALQAPMKSSARWSQARSILHHYLRCRLGRSS